MAKKDKVETSAARMRIAIRNFVLQMRKAETVHLPELKNFLIKNGITIADEIDKNLIQMLVSLAIKEPTLLGLNLEKPDSFFFSRR